VRRLRSDRFQLVVVPHVPSVPFQGTF
jgi:hypothetical protein